MKVYKISIPVGPITKALNAIYGYRKTMADYDELEKKCGTEEAVKRERGSVGLEERAKAIETINSFRKFAHDSLLEQINEQREAAVDWINGQVTPNGNDIMGENAADFAVLEHGLIATPEQLERILSKHTNPAFWTVGAQYAAQKGWEGFDFASKEHTTREYVSTVFEGLEAAANNPNGYSAMQYLNCPNEYERSAIEHGIGEEFALSGGGQIGSLIQSSLSGAGGAAGDAGSAE